TRRFPHAATVKQLADALALSEAARAELVAAARPAPVHAVPAGGRADIQATVYSLRHMVAPPTPLVGRADELETLLRRLTVERVRLLTLTGPAGVGKTRLALETIAALASTASEVTQPFPDGVVWVDL